MTETEQSIKQYGVLSPIIVRPDEDGGYEIISGHRRCYACELAGITEVPAIIRDIDRDAATIMMVDSNLQREEVLPCEKAQAYKMKLEAIKHQGQRTDLTSSQVETKFVRADQKVADEAGESRAQVQRYIRLTELIPELQQRVNDGKLGLTPAVEISYLNAEEQDLLLDTMDSEQCTPSLSQAQRMKKMSREGKLDEDSMLDIMTEQKKAQNKDIVLSVDQIRKYFPKSYSTGQMQMTIIKLLESWQRQREKKQTR